MVTVVTLLIFVVGARAGFHRDNIREVEDRLDHITHRIVKLENEIGGREGVRRNDGVGSLNHRVTEITGSGCQKDFFQCGGNDPQCVNNLLVCDGLKDCRNGADERECSLPFRSGDEFNCTELYFNFGPFSTKYPIFTVGSIESETFTTMAKVQITGSFPLDDEDSSRIGRGFVMTTTGIYSFATGILSLTWPMSDQLGWYVDFNSQLIRVVVGASDSECGKLAFSVGKVYDRTNSEANIA